MSARLVKKALSVAETLDVRARGQRVKKTPAEARKRANANAIRKLVESVKEEQAAVEQRSQIAQMIAASTPHRKVNAKLLSRVAPPQNAAAKKPSRRRGHSKRA